MMNSEVEPSLDLNSEKIRVPNITFEDVKNIIKNNELDPFSTNAAYIRDLAGHGSRTTINNHLKTIRNEIKPPPCVMSGAIPSAPADAVKVLWEAAYTAVQMQAFAKIESLTVQRDQAIQMAETQASDVDSFANEVDDLSAEICVLQEQLNRQEADFMEQVSSFGKEKEGWLYQLGESQAEIDLIRTENKIALADARHAAELAVRDATIREQALQSTITNLVNQVADLKSVLIDRTSPHT